MWKVLFLFLFLLSFACGPENRGNRSGEPAPTPEAPIDRSPPVDSLEECGPFEEGHNLNVCTATYIGAAGDHEALGVDIHSTGEVMVVVNLRPDEGSAEGMLLRFSPTGSELLATTSITDPIRSAAYDSQAERWALATAEELQLRSHDGTLLWTKDLENLDELAAYQGATVARRGKSVWLFDESGTLLTEQEVDRTALRGIAVYGNAETFYLTGFHQVSGNLQQPFIYAYAFDGNRRWTNYDWSAGETDGLSSDTRGEALAIGRDGKLYYVGESHGGVTTHFRNPRNIEEDAPINRRDPYSQSHNWNGAAPLGFVARFDALTGEIEGAQLLAVRLSNGRGNGVRPHFVTANEEGTIFLGGGSACCIEKWDQKEVAGFPAMPGYGGGQWTMALSPDFNIRHFWTTFHGGAPGVTLRGIAAAGPSAAVLHTHRGDSGEPVEGNMITSQALQPEAPGGLSNLHLSIFPAP